MDLRITQAIEQRRLLMFGYRGAVRVVEPHLYGRTSADHDALSAWMRPGWSRLDPEGGWRMFLVDEMENLQLLPDRFDGPHAGFNPEDTHFMQVYAAVAPPEELDRNG